jgi:hypothetical protein
VFLSDRYWGLKNDNRDGGRYDESGMTLNTEKSIGRKDHFGVLG